MSVDCSVDLHSNVDELQGDHTDGALLTMKWEVQVEQPVQTKLQFLSSKLQRYL